MHRSGIRLLPLLLLALGASGLSAQAASDTATLQGTVRSQSGLPLEGVRVRTEGENRETHTNARGDFSLVLPAGVPWVLHFEAEGFGSERVPMTALGVGETRTLVLTLTPLFRLDAVEVIRGREAPLLNTDDATRGGAVEGAELQGLPSDARDPLRLALTVPGVSQATAFFGDAPPLTIHGDNALYTQYLIDGLDNNEGFLGGPRTRLPLSALRRLEVQSTTYRPALGRSPNGVVSFETRSGGEAWTGELFLVGRPGTPLDASPKFTPAGVDPDGFRRAQFGGGIGGPLIRDRTFLFTAVELTEEREDRIGSTAQTNFLGTELRSTARAFGRLDHGWGPNQTTTLRMGVDAVERKGQGGGVIVPEADITTVRRGTFLNLTHRSALGGGRAANLFSVQWSTFRWDFPPSESDLSTPQVTIVAQDLTTVEAVVGSSNFIFDEREGQLQLQNVFEAQLGVQHTLRAGADLVRSSFELLGANTHPLGAWTVVNEGNIRARGPFVSIRDIPANVRVLRYTLDARPQQVNLGQTLVGAFVEHRWRPRPDLSLLSGLRWDYDDLTSRGESSPDLDNLQPRVSVNWLPGPRTSLRAGWGLYTGKFPYAVYSDAVQFGASGNAVITFEGEAFPPPPFRQGPSAAELAALEGGLPPREVRRMFARGLEQPVAQQLSLGWGREWGRLWSISIDAIRVDTRNLPRSWDLNAIERERTAADTLQRSVDFGDPFRPENPSITGYRRLTTTDSGGRAEHRALHTTVRRGLAGGVSVEGSWVWSRTQNDTEDINFHATQGNDFDSEWAYAINDRRHHLTLRTLWTPQVEGHWARLRLGGVADFQTGTPINRVAFFRDLDGAGGIFGNGFLGNHDRFPGVPRNGERLPSAFRMDGSATYGIPLRTGVLELRAEGFNLLNSSLKTGFANGIPGGGPRTQVGRPGDPVVFNTAAPPRQFQLSARWHF